MTEPNPYQSPPEKAWEEQLREHIRCEADTFLAGVGCGAMGVLLLLAALLVLLIGEGILRFDFYP